MVAPAEPQLGGDGVEVSLISVRGVGDVIGADDAKSRRRGRCDGGHVVVARGFDGGGVEAVFAYEAAEHERGVSDAAGEDAEVVEARRRGLRCRRS